MVAFYLWWLLQTQPVAIAWDHQPYPQHDAIMTWTQGTDAPACVYRLHEGAWYAFACVPAQAGQNAIVLPPVRVATLYPEPNDVWGITGVGSAVVPTRPWYFVVYVP